MTINPDDLTTDQLRAEVHRLIELSRKVNSQSSYFARALKRRLRQEREAAAYSTNRQDTPQQ